MSFEVLPQHQDERPALPSIASTTTSPLVPAIVANAGDHAARRFVEFFTATIRNANTRHAYARAVRDFFALCNQHRLTLLAIEPVHVAAYIEQLAAIRSAPTVKQHLAAIKMLFDWLLSGQVVAANPASSVRGPRHVVKRGKTPVLIAEEARHLLDSIPLRTGPEPKPGIADDRKSHLFPSAAGKSGRLTDRPMQSNDALRMIKRRAKSAGLSEAVGNHTFRATGITAFRANGGTLEEAREIANHASPKTTMLYDRSRDQITLDAVERIVI